MVFHSDAANLVPNDINGVRDLFVRGSVHYTGRESKESDILIKLKSGANRAELAPIR